MLTGEPNFVLIGVSAVFGLLIIIIIYYIFINKNAKSQSNQLNSTNMSSAMPLAMSSEKSTVVPINDGSTPFKPEPTGIQSKSAGVCGALGADVASINQLIDAHKTGADWCNVGWTKDGLAAYPIQYSTWKTLQDNEPNKRNICGAPGINLARNDPNLLYGVNCYGVKPEPKGNEKVKQNIISDKQLAINAKIAQFQKNINAIGVAPFNQDKWSE